jgi:SAM-dependent methyltransferase
LPYRDEQFDLVVARSVFEHIEHPEFTAAELLRITKPAGLIAAVTPNKYGYIALAARLVPNDRHITALPRSNLIANPEDIFPTYYRLNTRCGESSGMWLTYSLFARRRSLRTILATPWFIVLQSYSTSTCQARCNQRFSSTFVSVEAECEKAFAAVFESDDLGFRHGTRQLTAAAAHRVTAQ